MMITRARARCLHAHCICNVAGELISDMMRGEVWSGKEEEEEDYGLREGGGHHQQQETAGSFHRRQGHLSSKYCRGTSKHFVLLLPLNQPLAECFLATSYAEFSATLNLPPCRPSMVSILHQT